MSRKQFLKPFAVSVATLIAGTQAQAATETKASNIVSAVADGAPTANVGLTLSKTNLNMQFAQHESHSSHSSHDSHSSHSSSSL